MIFLRNTSDAENEIYQLVHCIYNCVRQAMLFLVMHKISHMALI